LSVPLLGTEHGGGSVCGGADPDAPLVANPLTVLVEIDNEVELPDHLAIEFDDLAFDGDGYGIGVEAVDVDELA